MAAASVSKKFGSWKVMMSIEKPLFSCWDSCSRTSALTLRSLQSEPNHEAISQPTPSRKSLIA